MPVRIKRGTFVRVTYHDLTGSANGGDDEEGLAVGTVIGPFVRRGKSKGVPCIIIGRALMDDGTIDGRDTFPETDVREIEVIK